VPSNRLRLIDPGLLRTLMERAPEGSLSIRALAEAAQASKSKIEALLSGARPTVDSDTATRIARAVGVHRGALFSGQDIHIHGCGWIEGEGNGPQ
jgi:plasmid maintenance system antidote protein VapI